MNRRSIIRGLVVFFVIAVFVYTVVIIATNARANLDKFAAFRWAFLPGVLALVLVNFVLRELKWDFFRRKAGIDVPRKPSFMIFFSGYSMCISPGRVGELIKPALYKEYYKAPLRKAVPLVFCERLTDLLGMVVICLVTIMPYIHDYDLRRAAAAATAGGAAASEQWTIASMTTVFAIAMAGLAALIGLARWKSFVLGTIAMLERVPKLVGPAEKLKHLYLETFDLLTFFNLSTMTLFATFSWFFECLAMYVLCMGLHIADVTGGPVTIYHCAFIFCISSIIGGLAFMFPGGMGPVEVLMLWLLVGLGVAQASASAAMFLTRFCTLIFGAALGFLFLWLTARAHRDSAVFDHMGEVIAEAEAVEGS